MLFASLPLDAKVTPEQVLDQRARIAKPAWPMWSYGKRGDMIRDLHWPVRNAEGKLVTKEVAGNASGYVHAHLLHAYIGINQDVMPEQIECRNYRLKYAPSPPRRARWAPRGSERPTGAPPAAALRRNPHFMLKSDGLMPIGTPKPADSARSGPQRGPRFSSPKERAKGRGTAPNAARGTSRTKAGSKDTGGVVKAKSVAELI